MRWITLIYITIIVIIIAMADSGQYGYLFKMVHKIPYGDKLGHFILIGLLAFVVNLSLQCRKILVFRYSVLQGSAIVVALVMLEELSQFFIANRSFDLIDLLFDFMGIFVFSHIAVILTNNRRIKSEK